MTREQALSQKKKKKSRFIQLIFKLKCIGTKNIQQMKIMCFLDSVAQYIVGRDAKLGMQNETHLYIYINILAPRNLILFFSIPFS